jgi:hypothetical protein
MHADIKSKLKEIFEKTAKKEVEVRNKFEAMKSEVYKKYDAEKYEEMQDELYQIEVEENKEVDQLYEDAKQEILKINEKLEVELFVYQDAHCYFSANNRSFYDCYDEHAIHDLANKKTYVVFVDFKELNYEWGKQYKFEGIEIEEKELIDEENTPFTSKLIENVPWCYIRDTWVTSLKQLIEKIAEAEVKHKLQETLQEVKAKVEASLWIYDYYHFYDALIKTCEQFNIKI